MAPLICSSRIPAVFTVIILMTVVACGVQNDNEAASLARREHYAEVIEVRTAPVVRGSFARELITNGRLRAVTEATVHFRVNEMIKEVNVINGQWVNKGDLLAVLEEFPFTSRLERALDQVERTRLELEDVLLGHGYFLRDSLRVPEHIWNMARIRSGYNAALNDLAEARYQMSGTRLKAPVSGVIAGLEAKPHNHSSAYQNFCVIVDNSQLEARFPVLESETSMIAAGQTVEVRPFAARDKSFSGKVTGFDPRVDEQGMVMVRALVDNPAGELIDGMNVQVIIKREMTGQLIIPREALVLRQGRQVVFTLQDSLAMWNYVETGLENSRQFTVNEGLTEGQEVIISGNFNLAHETRVKRAD
ncbi:MAG: efflux RND transporter periplasmic adaptor subunit [Marinilabiliales bacterium]|nr:MAG: efflux RND transporter periplasmic adaptor subunit [Marinilabiliales bacterium]